ncbi:MAG: TIGR03546 family protein [Elusimicrobia bacterium]|nr:TIGR03546 family protein [Candidatus Obscuribacterium magneticum]
MLLIIKFLAKILSLLNSEVSPKQIAAGFAYGVLLGLVPVGMFSSLLLLFALIINFNLASLFLATAILKLLSFAVDPLANKLGYLLLVKMPSLTAFWTKLYNTPLVPYTKFNNTLVMGSFAWGLLLLIPAFFLAVAGIKGYRIHVRDKVLKFKVMQMIKASSLYKYYASFRGLAGQ